MNFKVFKVSIISLGRYIWAESHEVFDYVNWAHDNPSDDGEGDADCVWKTFSYNPGWHDAPCTLEYWDNAMEQVHALCETDIGEIL